MNHYRLNNGVKIPVLGFGTWKAADGEEAYQAVLAALKAGYRAKTCLLPPNFGILITHMKMLKLL